MPDPGDTSAASDQLAEAIRCCEREKAEVDRLNRAITRVLRLLADQETYCGDERLDVPSWVGSVRKALNDE